MEKNDKKLIFSSYKTKKEQKFSNLNFLANIKLTGDIALLNLNNSKNTLYTTNLNGATEIIEKPWLITRHSHSRNNIGFKLHEGDFIKLGKIIFKIKEIRIKQNKIRYKNITQEKDKLRVDRTLNDNNNINNLNYNNLNYNNANDDYSYNVRVQSGLNILNQTNQILGENGNMNTGLRHQHTNDFNSKPSEIKVIDNGENGEKLIIKENKKRRFK